MGEPAKKPDNTPADKIPQKVKDALEKAEKEYAEKTMEGYRQLNADKSTRTMSMEIARGRKNTYLQDLWWLADFYDEKHSGVKQASAAKMHNGWWIAVNPKDAVVKLDDVGAQIPGTIMIIGDKSPIGTGSHYETTKAMRKEYGDSKNYGLIKCGKRGTCLDRDSIASMAFYWPASMQNDDNDFKTRRFDFTGCDKGYTVDCKGVKADEQVTQVNILNGSSRVEWGKDTRGVYVANYATNLPQTLVIPASRAQDFSTWSQGGEKATAFALYLEEKDPKSNSMKRSNAYNVGHDSSQPMGVSAQQFIEVEGDTDSKLGKTYRKRIPLFRSERSDGTGGLVLRPLAEVSAEVKAAPAELDKEHKADLAKLGKGR